MTRNLARPSEARAANAERGERWDSERTIGLDGPTSQDPVPRVVLRGGGGVAINTYFGARTQMSDFAAFILDCALC